MLRIKLSNDSEYEPGCVFDGALGWHNHKRLIDLARDEGMPLTPRDFESLSRYEASKPSDNDVAIVMDNLDRAENFLNDLTPDGFSFGWYEGDFIFQSDEWWTICTPRDL